MPRSYFLTSPTHFNPNLVSSVRDRRFTFFTKLVGNRLMLKQMAFSDDRRVEKPKEGLGLYRRLDYGFGVRQVGSGV